MAVYSAFYELKVALVIGSLQKNRKQNKDKTVSV
jgi:hypothetical protein